MAVALAYTVAGRTNKCVSYCILGMWCLFRGYENLKSIPVSQQISCCSELRGGHFRR